MAVELTETQRRFLKRVATITYVPWSGKVEAFDAAGKKMRISKATFELLKSDNLIIREQSSLTTDTYVLQPPPVVTAEVAAAQQ
ncbi:MAG TPA: hypothetical protein VMF90_02890 [Rhizobiaceae bacterium]|nr:hypothetical protein [Rhizobiaceae bacterium]